jgi:RNA polymerase subunit RPABC4/transcription elongation factor Spt4
MARLKYCDLCDEDIIANDQGQCPVHKDQSTLWPATESQKHLVVFDTMVAELAARDGTVYNGEIISSDDLLKKYTKADLRKAFQAARKEKLGWSDEQVLKYKDFEEYFNDEVLPPF